MTGQFAVDTNLLIYPTSRRLLHGIALETGSEIALLPEVVKEVIERRHLADAEMSRWERRRATRLRSLPVLQRDAIEEAISRAALEWWADISNRPPFRILKTDRSGNRHMRDIAGSIPATVFAEPRQRDELAGDPMVVAQAIYFDVDLLSSNNLNTMAREELNSWLVKKGWNRPLIHSASDTIKALAGGNIDIAYTWIMAHGMKQMFDTEELNRDEFRKTLAILGDAGFREKNKKTDTFNTIVFDVRRLFECDDRFHEKLIQCAKAHAQSRSAAIESELLLNRKVNEALECLTRA